MSKAKSAIDRAISIVMKRSDQKKTTIDQFRRLFDNIVSKNVGPQDLENMIESVSLDEESS